MNIDVRNVLLSFPNSELRKRIVIWINNNAVFTTTFFGIFHKIYTKQVPFQKSETHTTFLLKFLLKSR